MARKAWVNATNPTPTYSQYRRMTATPSRDTVAVSRNTDTEDGVTRSSRNVVGLVMKTLGGTAAVVLATTAILVDGSRPKVVHVQRVVKTLTVMAKSPHLPAVHATKPLYWPAGKLDGLGDTQGASFAFLPGHLAVPAASEGLRAIVPQSRFYRAGLVFKSSYGGQEAWRVRFVAPGARPICIFTWYDIIRKQIVTLSDAC